jgi:plasmid stability protein
MSLKKFDLAKNLGLKVAGRMRAAGVPDRFAQGAAEALDKRERRARDAALGLVPFACKLPADLVKRLNERGVAHEGGVNGLLAELLAQALEGGEEAPAKKAPAAKKAAAKKAPAKKAAEPKDSDQP